MKICIDLVVFPIEKKSKTSREVSDYKSQSWTKKALPTSYNSNAQHIGKKGSKRAKTNLLPYVTITLIFSFTF